MELTRVAQQAFMLGLSLSLELPEGKVMSVADFKVLGRFLLKTAARSEPEILSGDRRVREALDHPMLLDYVTLGTPTEEELAEMMEEQQYVAELVINGIKMRDLREYFF